MLNLVRIRTQPRSNRSGMDYADSKKKNNFVGKILVAAMLTALCILMLNYSPNFNTPTLFSRHEPGVNHVLVTGGAGYIGSHAALRLLKDSYRVTIVDNLSRGNLGAVRILQELFPEPGRFQFIYADLGDAKVVHKIFSQNAFDAVMHFAAVAYVGESTLDPLKYYHNITSNTLTVLEAMATRGVPTLIYSSTCATCGEPEKMPITEETPQLPINPYGKAKKMSEDIILDFHKNSNMAVMILRYFNVIGSDPNGRLGEAPRPELREHGRISGACFDAARGIIPGVKVRGTDYKTADGTCIRDYIDVTDLVDAHVKALEKARPGKAGIYNVGTGRGKSVKEFVEACKAATGVPIKVDFLPRRGGATGVRGVATEPPSSENCTIYILRNFLFMYKYYFCIPLTNGDCGSVDKAPVIEPVVAGSILGNDTFFNFLEPLYQIFWFRPCFPVGLVIMQKFTAIQLRLGMN